MSVTEFRRNVSDSLRRFSLLLVVLLLYAGYPSIHTAHADDLYYFAQVTCAPELGYFSIRRFLILDLPSKGPYLTEGLEPGPAAVAALQRKYGIFDSKGLQDDPFECSLPPVQAAPGWEPKSRPAYKIRVVGHFDQSSGTTIAYVQVFLDGKSIGYILLNGGERTDSIEVWYDALLEVRTCEITPEIGASEHLACRYEPFKAGAQ
jgi:hypothetical protein